MAWRRVVCAAGFSENHLKNGIRIAPFCGKIRMFCERLPFWILSVQQRFFRRWAANPAAFNEFGENV